MLRPNHPESTLRTRAARAFLLVAAVWLAGPVPANASSIQGIPVAGLGTLPTGPFGHYPVSHDPTPDGVSNATDGWIKYFIPLRSATSGTYGVNGRGMAADTGSGGSWLYMNLIFEGLAPRPFTTARLAFEFSDLDLRYVNDPAGFLETVRIYSRYGSSVGPLTRRFTQATGSGESGIYNGIEYQLSRTPGTDGRNWPLYLSLWGEGLEALLTDPFWVQLRFTIPTGVPYGRNTPEYLRASLITESALAVPEPAALLLFGAGLGFVAVASRRRSKV